MDVFEGGLRVSVTQQLADGHHCLALRHGDACVGMPRVVKRNVVKTGFASQPVPEMVHRLRRQGRAGGAGREDPASPPGQSVEDPAGRGGQPDRARPGLGIAQEQLALAVVGPLEGEDFALATTRQQQ